MVGLVFEILRYLQTNALRCFLESAWEEKLSLLSCSCSCSESLILPNVSTSSSPGLGVGLYDLKFQTR